jgi:hypothetical protein
MSLEEEFSSSSQRDRQRARIDASSASASADDDDDDDDDDIVLPDPCLRLTRRPSPDVGEPSLRASLEFMPPSWYKHRRVLVFAKEEEKN